jgi:hypothetical protein
MIVAVGFNPRWAQKINPVALATTDSTVADATLGIIYTHRALKDTAKLMRRERDETWFIHTPTAFSA